MNIIESLDKALNDRDSKKLVAWLSFGFIVVCGGVGSIIAPFFIHGQSSIAKYFAAGSGFIQGVGVGSVIIGCLAYVLITHYCFNKPAPRLGFLVGLLPLPIILLIYWFILDPINSADKGKGLTDIFVEFQYIATLALFVTAGSLVFGLIFQKWINTKYSNDRR